jgi:hypothetical protein
MKTKKTVLAFILLTVLAVTAYAQQYADEKDFSVAQVSGGTAVKITRYTGNRQTINIPPAIQGKPVVEIGENVFFRQKITGVTIPNSVTSIGVGVFANNQLTSVTIPNSVTSIGRGVFANNQLTSAVFPNSATSIGDSAFYNNKLTSVTIPDSITSIGDSTFERNRLTSVTIPDSVTSIGKEAFRNNQLTSITIGAKVKIENDSFSREFFDFYNAQGQRAGTYTYSNHEWSIH